jgi:hypothetical protein
MIERRLLTAAVVGTLEGHTGKPVGLANAPLDGGWEGEPNVNGSNFVPYTVVTPNTATMASGPQSDPQGDRQVPYSLASFGVLPEQAEWMADTARAAVEQLKKTTVTLGDRDYKIQQVRTDVIGGLVRVDSTDPPYWGQVDVVTLWLTPA